MFDTTTPKDVYLDDQTYHRMKNRLTRFAAGEGGKFGVCPETEIVRILGEVGGVWPRSVMDDAERVA